jgi:pyruvate kinase
LVSRGFHGSVITVILWTKVRVQSFSAMRESGARQAARELLGEVAALRRTVAQQGRSSFRRWKRHIARREFSAGALNLAHYLALRRHDLRPLQQRLMPLGLSSLGRAESRVLASLDAVVTALAALVGTATPAPSRMPTERQFFRGEHHLAGNTNLIFGSPAISRPGRILVTLGTDAAEGSELIERIAASGADAFRINCAHDNPDLWAKMIAHIHAAEHKLGRQFRILMDIGGPKVRTAAVATPDDRNRLRIGDELLLCRNDVAGTETLPFRTGCSLPQVFDRLKVGDRISIDDGKLRGRIVRQTPEGLVASIEEGRGKGLKLKPEKGLNFPEVDLGLGPLTAEDRVDLDFIVRHADMIGYSFVQTADHVAQLQAELAARRNDWQRLALVAKIETPKAVHNLPAIMVQAAGQQPLTVMIARGDLAIELGFERVAEMQEEILWLCEAAYVPAIWATQVLEGLVSKGLPSRGEMTDAAMAARAECVMLNKGPNIVAGVMALNRLLHRMSEHQRKKTPTLRALHSWEQ